MRTLENWSMTCIKAGPFSPPEAGEYRLQGEAYGNPRFEDGKSVCTSAIMSVGGRRVETSSGSVYILGKPSEKYIEWCREQGCHIPTNEEPIKNQSG